MVPEAGRNLRGPRGFREFRWFQGDPGVPRVFGVLAIPLISRTSFISFIVRSKHKKINKKVIFSTENYLPSQSMISSFYENSKHPSKNHFSIELS